MPLSASTQSPRVVGRPPAAPVPSATARGLEQGVVGERRRRSRRTSGTLGEVAEADDLDVEPGVAAGSGAAPRSCARCGVAGRAAVTRASAACWSRVSSAQPATAEVEQLVEQRAVERRALGGALHLDEAAVAGADDVHVGLGARRPPRSRGRAAASPSTTPTDTAATDAVSAIASALTSFLALGPGDGVGEGDVGAGDRGGAGAAVGLQDVAVEDDRCSRRAPRCR